MYSLTPTLKFLLDENVKRKLYQFLKSNAFDVKLAPGGSTDAGIARISKKEKRILVTNDEDFIYYSPDKVFAVIWLRIPQAETKILIDSFVKLLHELENFSGKLITLNSNEWIENPLVTEVEI